jgi:DNA-binding CsgD family transcriptional regulator
MPGRLTDRERQVAAGAAAGRSNEQIAEELGIGARTVEWNLTRVYRKLGVRSRRELAAAQTPWAERTEEQADRPIGGITNRRNTGASGAGRVPPATTREESS